MLKVVSQAATEAKTFFEFKDALQLIWSALSEKVINNAVKDYRKRQQACVLTYGGHFKHTI